MTTINIFVSGAMSNVYGDKWSVEADRPLCAAERGRDEVEREGS